MNQYDNSGFFAEYAKMSRSQYGLEGAGEWHQLEPMFPELAGKAVLDLGCGMAGTVNMLQNTVHILFSASTRV